MADSFNKLCNWLEETSDCEMYTLKDFHDKMYELSDSKCIYSERRLKQKLKDHFKEHIYFTEFPGKADVICFRDRASHIIYKLKNKPVETKEDVIIAAAKIIRSELRELRKTIDEYPALEYIKNLDKNREWIPESLQLLLHYLIPCTLIQVNLCQCITQASRPRSVMCPIVFEKTMG